MGLVQRGRSRLWIDDQGWWLINVEFQPSSWSRGSYLNVGVQWLWHRSPTFSFEFGNRVAEAGFMPFETPEEFDQAANRLAALAAEKVYAYRSLVSDVASLPRVLATGGTLDTRNAYHVAVALALIGDTAGAETYMARAMIASPTTGWHREWNEQVRAVCELLSDPARLRGHVTSVVLDQRMCLKLDQSRPIELPGSDARGG